MNRSAPRQRRHAMAFFLVSLACLAVGPTEISQPLVAQEQPQAERARQQPAIPPMAERVRMGVGKYVIVLDDLNVVRSDLKRMFKDLRIGLGSLPDQMLEGASGSGVSIKGGFIGYWQTARFRDILGEFVIEDRKKIRGMFDQSEEVPETGDLDWLDLGDVTIPMEDGLLGSVDSGKVIGNQLLLGTRSSLGAMGGLEKGSPAAKRLDKVGCDILNRSGIAFLATGEQLKADSYGEFKVSMNEAFVDLTEAEKEWLGQLRKLANTTDVALVGLKYHAEQVFEIRSQLTIDKQGSFDALFRFPEAGIEWDADLGLEEDQLAIAGAINFKAFSSSAGPRSAAHLLLQESSRQQSTRFLAGNMLKLLAELVGDSWNDLDAARLGLYKNDPAEDVGDLALLSVVDAKDPRIVIRELKRISTLTAPRKPTDLKRKTAANQEIARLIEKLGSADSSVAARAESRLRLAGQMAIDALEKAKPKLAPAVVKRAERVIRRIRQNLVQREDSRPDVFSPMFWTTLNPGLELEDQVAELAGFPMYSIKATPDASKSEAEVRTAVAVMTQMFGKQWDTVRVVQVNDNLVFMVGSDLDLLKRTVERVSQGAGELVPEKKKIGFSEQDGPLQVFFNVPRLSELTQIDRGIRNPQGDKEPISGCCWMGVHMEPHSIGLDLLVPVKQIVPFFMGGF